MKVKNSAHVAALYGMLIALAFVLSFVETDSHFSWNTGGKAGTCQSGHDYGALYGRDRRNGFHFTFEDRSYRIYLWKLICHALQPGRLELKPSYNGSLQEKKTGWVQQESVFWEVWVITSGRFAWQLLWSSRPECSFIFPCFW